MDKQLQHIIQQGENEKVEFKSSFGDDVIISLVAFANSGNILWKPSEKLC